MQDSNRQIKIGGMISYLTIGFSILAGLVYTPWMISIIGQSDFGLFTLGTSLVTMVTIDLGLSQAVTRFISKYRAEKDNESIRKFLGITYKLFMLLSGLFLILLTILYFNVDRIFVKLSPEEIIKVKVLLSIAGLYAVISFPFQPLDGLLVSGEWFIFQNTTALITKVLNIVLMVAALMMGYGLYSLVIVNAFCGIVVIGLKFYFIRRNDRQEISWKGFDRQMAKQIFSFSLWVMVVTIAQRLIINITPSILGMTSGSRDIAMFSAAMTIEGYVWTFSTVFAVMFLPKVSKLIYGDKADPHAIEALMIKVGRIQFLMLAAIVSVFLVTGRVFFLKWLGSDFENSYIITVFLILPGLIIIPQEIAATALIASNKVKFIAFSKIIVAAVSISLSYVLSLRYGATGAGIAIFTGNIIGGIVVLNIIYARVLRINIWEFFKECQLKMAMPFLIVIFAGIGLNYLLTEISWINLLIKVMILIILYSASAYIFVMNNYEKDLIFGIIKKKLK